MSQVRILSPRPIKSTTYGISRRPAGLQEGLVVVDERHELDVINGQSCRAAIPNQELARSRELHGHASRHVDAVTRGRAGV